MEWLYAVLLAAAVAVLVAAEWPRLAARLGREDGVPRVPRRRRKATHLRLVEDETDEFAASVQRDLERLPTIDERER